MVYQRYVPNAFLLDKVYNEMIKAENLLPREMKKLTIPRFEYVAGELIELFAMVRKPPNQIRFLDYGFGYGGWARVATALGAKVYATETSPDKVEYGKKIGVEMLGEDA